MNKQQDPVILIVKKEQRLDLFLAESFPKHSRTKLAGWIKAGGVFVNGKFEKPSFLLKPGTQVEIFSLPETAPHTLEPFKLSLEIHYEDEYLLVVNKPRGVATHPAPSLKEPSLVHALLAYADKLSTGSAAYRPGIVHRLDKETTGLLVVAKTDEAHHQLSLQIQRKEAQRRYVALVFGKLNEPKFTIQAPIARNPRNRILMCINSSGKMAITHLKLIRTYDKETLVAAKLETGRTHQIRVHLASYAHPIKGDHLYAKGTWSEGPMQLHAAFLAFKHPITGKPIEIYASPPEDFLKHEDLKSEDLCSW